MRSANPKIKLGNIFGKTLLDSLSMFKKKTSITKTIY